MFNKFLPVILIVLSFNLDAIEYYSLPAVNVEKLKQTEIKPNGPLKYAVVTTVNDIYNSKQDRSKVSWQKNTAGQMEYTLRLSADNATSINVGMTDFFLPPSAELWIYNDDKSLLRGPYNDRYNPKNGHFWIGDVPGDHANLTFTVKQQEQPYLSFNINQVARGFYEYWKSPADNGLKSGSCNVDVACPEGDDWRPEISSVASLTFTDGFYRTFCTGQLINNTAQDNKPYILTASHCGFSDSSTSEKESLAASLNIIWNYESQTCRTPGSGSSGTPISTSTFNQRQAGATFIANNTKSDFALLLLNQIPDTNYDIHYTGWDRSDTIFDGAVAIHHPSGHAKRITIDYDPLKIIGLNYLGKPTTGNTHLQVLAWDTGTTETGSSGGGLWNNDYRLIGQLHGGTIASCGTPISDWFGRFYYSWDKGSTPQSRLKDWLDPIDSQQMTLDTAAQCDAPVVDISTPNNIKVGETAVFSAQVSGGSGGYQYSWDLNGDGQPDGHDSSLSTRYSQAYVGNVTLTVKDDSGCQGVDSRAVIVKAPDVQIVGQPIFTQLCGNNDNNIDPGERWRATVTVQNTGDQAVGGGHLLFNMKAEQQHDKFGNSSAQCYTKFIDISQNGTHHPWTLGPVTGTTADDEGYAKIQLGQSFQHYDQTVSTLVASTNGYLNTYGNANGIDWDNDCPLPASPDKDSTGGRIAVMHDDLNSSTFYHKSFNDCPRDAETGENLACDVFLWKGAYYYGGAAINSMDIQAILYPHSSQWVFQHRGPGADGASATVGIQNTAATDGLTFACDTANSLSEEQAVCVYHKNHPNQNKQSFVTLETPVVAFNNLGINDSQTVAIDFAVDEDAVCGNQLTINHAASVFAEGFNAGQYDAISFAVGNNGQCPLQLLTQCEIDDDNTLSPQPGLWWNPERSGNGLEFKVLDKDRLMYVLYTGQTNGAPVWYTADNDDSGFNHFYNNIYEVNYPGGFDQGNKQFRPVGWSSTYFLDNSNALQVREINGRLSAEKIERQVIGSPPTSNEHTGQYFACSQPGWGMTVFTEGDQRAVVSYLYDLDGQPYWTYSGGANDSTSMPSGHYQTFCPHCPWVQPVAEQVGTIRLQMNGQSGGLIQNYDLVYPYAGQTPLVDWQRNNLSVTNVYTGSCQ